MRGWFVVGLAVACSACGGGEGGGQPASGGPAMGNAVSGTFNGGYTLTAKDAVFNVGDWSNGFSFHGPSTAVVISDYASLCGFQSLNQAPANSQMLALVMGAIDAAGNSSAVAAPGDYLVPTSSNDYLTPNTLRAAAWWEFGGASCFRATTDGAATGTGHVVVTSVTATRIAGTFDVVFTTSGSRVTGSFDAAPCAGVNLNRSPTCAP